MAYGFRREEGKKGSLVLDGEAAEIVKDIFKWRLEGMSCFAISQQLNRLNILSPWEYQRYCGLRRPDNFVPMARWSSVTVKRVLENKLYIGDIIPESVFLDTARLSEVDIRAMKGTSMPHIFSGLLFCGDCGQPMGHRVNRYKGMVQVSYICQTRNKGKGCTRHCIREPLLCEAVLDQLQAYAKRLLNTAQARENVLYLKQLSCLEEINREVLIKFVCLIKVYEKNKVAVQFKNED